MPALITVQELLSDTEFLNFNHDQCKITLDQCRNQIQAAAGTGVTLQFVPVPVLFFGEGTPSGATDASLVYGGAVSLCPVACNLQELGINVPPVNSGIYLPRQFAPVIDNGNTGRDIFENAILASNIGNQIFFVDDWKGYHRYSGDVHCGTNVKRIVPPNNWWQ